MNFVCEVLMSPYLEHYEKFLKNMDSWPYLLLSRYHVSLFHSSPYEHKTCVPIVD